MYVPETKWSAPQFQSFDAVVSALAAHIQGQPQLQAKGWPVDYGSLAERVDEFNAAIAKQMGWNDWITDGGGSVQAPFMQSPPAAPVIDQNKLSAAASSIRSIWQGIKTISDWLDSKEPAVAPELSTSRAKTCSECPMNEPGDFEKWFTKPAAEGMRRQLAKLSERKLSTPYDGKLHTCKACLCVNSLSVHTPIEIKVGHMSQEVYDALKAAPACWVVAEGKAIGRT